MTQTQASDKLTAALDEIRERQENARVTLHDIAAVADDAPRLLAALDAVLKLADKDATTGVPPVRIHEAISRALSGGAA